MMHARGPIAAKRQSCPARRWPRDFHQRAWLIFGISQRLFLAIVRRSDVRVALSLFVWWMWSWARYVWKREGFLTISLSSSPIAD